MEEKEEEYDYLSTIVEKEERMESDPPDISVDRPEAEGCGMMTVASVKDVSVEDLPVDCVKLFVSKFGCRDEVEVDGGWYSALRKEETDICKLIGENGQEVFVGLTDYKLKRWPEKWGMDSFSDIIGNEIAFLSYGSFNTVINRRQTMVTSKSEKELLRRNQMNVEYNFPSLPRRVTAVDTMVRISPIIVMFLCFITASMFPKGLITVLLLFAWIPYWVISWELYYRYQHLILPNLPSF